MVQLGYELALSRPNWQQFFDRPIPYICHVICHIASCDLIAIGDLVIK